MAQPYIKQHKRGRYTGIQRGSSFFVVVARCGAFPRTFPPHWKKYARNRKKGLFWAIFRHWQQVNTLFYKCTTKLFLLATSKRKKQIFRKNKALECAEWRVLGVWWAKRGFYALEQEKREFKRFTASRGGFLGVEWRIMADFMISSSFS